MLVGGQDHRFVDEEAVSVVRRDLLLLEGEGLLEKLSARFRLMLLVDKVLKVSSSVGRVDAVIDHFILLPYLLRRQQSLGVDLVVLSLDSLKEVVLSLARLAWGLIIDTVDLDSARVQDGEYAILLHDLIINYLFAGEHQFFVEIQNVDQKDQLDEVVANELGMPLIPRNSLLVRN